MRKIYSLVLIAAALLVGTNAWAQNVAKIGETEYATVAAAIAAADNGATITLLADAGGNVILDKDITFNGDKKFTGNITISASEVTLTLAGVTIDVTGNDAIVHVGKTLNVIVAEGTTNAVYAKSNGCDCFYGTSNGHLNISGNGTLDVYGLEALHVSYMNLSAPNATYGASKTLMYEPHIVSATISAGTFDREFPDSYVTAPLFIEKVSSAYVVSNIGANKAVCDYTAYASLQAAVNAAAVGATIVMYADDNSTIAVGKNIIIDTKGHSATGIVAASGYHKAVMGEKVAINDNEIATFLMADGTASLTVEENADISAAGVIHVNGNKTLTINSGVTVTYKRQGDLANIVVDNGAKLTVLGSGTFTPVMHSETNTIDGFTAEISTTASNHIGNRIIDVDGELVVGVMNDANNCPHFITSSLARGNAVMVNATGVATFNNADMHVASVSIKNYGNVTIHGGEYVSIATCKNEINNGWYAYHLNNEGIMTVNGGHFVGVQGAFANVSANAIVTINGGYFETVNGHNWKTGAANTGANADNHYALYVACYSVVNVYGGYYKVTIPSAGGGKVALVGNNDAYNTYGIVNLYGGNFQRKVEVSPRKNADSSYPASIPSTSQWYGCFGTEAPLPAGYEYYETGDATYPYGVRVIPGTETAEVEVPADPTATIPWQQNTTWDATADPSEEDIVPEENTIVTIPVGATVVVSNAAEDIAAGGDEAEAKQIFISQDANLIVESGTMLTVGDGGVNIGNGGQLTIEPGAIIKIGSAGIITTEETALVVETSEETPSVLLYAPTVEENTQPQATYRFTSKARHQTSPNKWVWQRFGIPSSDGSTTMSWTPGIRTVLEEFNYSTNSWNKIYDGNDGTFVSNATRNFQCYIMTTDAPDAGTIYDFSGNLMGNQNASFDFVKGWNYYANSYTAPVSIKEMLTDVLASYGSTVSATAYIYRAEDNWWDEVNLGIIDLADLGLHAPVPTEINPMQAFILYLYNGNTESGEIINYEDHIYNPIMGVASSAPARNNANSGFDGAVVMSITDGTYTDQMSLIEDASFSVAFDNGYDSYKYMNSAAFNMYASSNNEKFGTLATDNLSGTLMDFNATTDGQYTITFTGVMGKQYVLRDLYTNVSVNIVKDGTYSFYAQAGDNESRFMLVGPSNMPTKLETVEQEAVKASGIYSITGQYLGEASILTTLPKGVYVVDGVKVVK